MYTNCSAKMTIGFLYELAADEVAQPLYNAMLVMLLKSDLEIITSCLNLLNWSSWASMHA